jgi:hypothetical protein
MRAIFVNPINLHVLVTLAPKPRKTAALYWHAPTLLKNERCAIGPHTNHRFNTASAWGRCLFRAMTAISAARVRVNESRLRRDGPICVDEAFDKTLLSPITTITTTSSNKPLLILPNSWAEVVSVVAMAPKVKNIVHRVV